MASNTLVLPIQNNNMRTFSVNSIIGSPNDNTHMIHNNNNTNTHNNMYYFNNPNTYVKPGFIDESMKNDGFATNYFNDEFEPNSTVSSHTTSAEDSLQSSPTPANHLNSNAPNGLDMDAYKLSGAADEEYSCPCCGQVCPGGAHYHSHVTSCYMTRFLNHKVKCGSPADSGASEASDPDHEDNEYNNTFLSPIASPEPSTTTDPANTFNPSSTIASLQACVGQLDIHQRISLMEAFNRLSRSAAQAIEANKTSPHTNLANNNQTSPAASNKPFHVDEKVISLLYSPAPNVQSRYTSPAQSPLQSHMQTNNNTANTAIDPTPIKRVRSISHFTYDNNNTTNSTNNNITQPRAHRPTNANRNRSSPKSSKNIFGTNNNTNYSNAAFHSTMPNISTNPILPSMPSPVTINMNTSALSATTSALPELRRNRKRTISQSSNHTPKSNVSMQYQ